MIGLKSINVRKRCSMSIYRTWMNVVDHFGSWRNRMELAVISYWCNNTGIYCIWYLVKPSQHIKKYFKHVASSRIGWSRSHGTRSNRLKTSYVGIEASRVVSKTTSNGNLNWEVTNGVSNMPHADSNMDSIFKYNFSSQYQVSARYQTI